MAPLPIVIARRSPLPGVVVGRRATAESEPLWRSVLDRFATSLQLAGRSHWRSGNERWSSSPGSLSLKVPGAVTAELARAGPTEHQVVLFDEALVDDARAALDRRWRTARHHPLDPRDARTRPVAELHAQLLDGDDVADVAALAGSVCAALTALVDIACAPPGSAHARSAFSSAVARARALLDERLTETVTLDELAAHARLDKFHLCRAFRDEVGLPPHAYVTHRRVSRAQELLARGVPQAEVAARVGLYDQSQLHRHFKRILGVTPGAFARAVR